MQSKLNSVQKHLAFIENSHRFAQFLHLHTITNGAFSCT